MKQEAPQQRHSRWESSDFQSEEHVNMGTLLLWRLRVVPVRHLATRVDTASAQNSSAVWST